MRNRFLILSVFYLFTRLWQIDVPTASGDERFTLFASNGICMGGKNQLQILESESFTPKDFWQPIGLKNYSDAVAMSEIGAHLPYNLTLQAWQRLFGKADITLRLFSILCGWLALFFFVKTISENQTNQWIPWIFGLLFCLEPLLLSQNRMIRSYSFSMALVSILFYVFALIIKHKEKPWQYFLLAFCISAATLTHYLNYFVVIAMALVFVFKVKDKSTWIKTVSAVLIASFLIYLWMTIGAGQWAFKFMADKNALHQKLAQMPGADISFVGLPTWHHILVRMQEIISDLFVLTNGMWEQMPGKKNFIFVFGLAVLSALFRKNNKTFSMSVGIVLYFSIAYNLLYASLFAFVYLSVIFIKNLNKSHWLWYLAILVVFIPHAYMPFEARSAGHTGNMVQRYAFYAMPFAVLLVSGVVAEIFKQERNNKILLLVMFLPQLYSVVKKDYYILQNNSSKYCFNTKKQIPNPYFAIAEKIKKEFQPGDHIVYPSFDESDYTTILGKKKGKIVLDAQYVNIYLPADLYITQSISATESDKIVRQRKGQNQILFDFKGRTYRY